MPKIITHIVVSAIFSAVVLLISVTHARAQTAAGSVSAVSGIVSVERAGRSIPAADGSAVQVGDKFTTGPNSRITIKLSDGSQLELNESSTLVLTEDTLNPDGSRASTKVTLMSGLVRSLVRFNPAGAPNFEVHTPNAVASARGTMFDVSYHEGQPPPANP
jgi:hypothetical protein